MIIMYGIKNCDTIKKARKFLENNNIDYQFHDFREDGLNPIQLRAWMKELGWEKIINKRSTTWRNLPATSRGSVRTGSPDTLPEVATTGPPTSASRRWWSGE